MLGSLMDELQLERALGDVALPPRVTAACRDNGTQRYVFVLSFNRETTTLSLGDTAYTDALSGASVSGDVALPGYAHRVLVR